MLQAGRSRELDRLAEEATLCFGVKKQAAGFYFYSVSESIDIKVGDFA